MTLILWILVPCPVCCCLSHGSSVKHALPEEPDSRCPLKSYGGSFEFSSFRCVSLRGCGAARVLRSTLAVSKSKIGLQRYIFWFLHDDQHQWGREHYAYDHSPCSASTDASPVSWFAAISGLLSFLVGPQLLPARALSALFASMSVTARVDFSPFACSRGITAVASVTAFLSFSRGRRLCILPVRFPGHETSFLSVPYPPLSGPVECVSSSTAPPFAPCISGEGSIQRTFEL